MLIGIKLKNEIQVVEYLLHGPQFDFVFVAKLIYDYLLIFYFEELLIGLKRESMHVPSHSTMFSIWNSSKIIFLKVDYHVYFSRDGQIFQEVFGKIWDIRDSLLSPLTVLQHLFITFIKSFFPWKWTESAFILRQKKVP